MEKGRGNLNRNRSPFSFFPSPFRIKAYFWGSILNRPRMTQTPADLPPDLTGLRVLVADDNALNLLIARKFLTRRGATVETAEDGTTAVEKIRAEFARQEPFHLVLLDIQMPNLDGFGASRVIREFDPAVAILAMSADELPDETIASNGMNGFILKPFDPDALVERIQEVLPGFS